MSPAGPLQNAHSDSDQERSDSQPRHAPQLPSMHQEYSESLTTLPQVPGVVPGSLKETHPPSADAPCNANTDLKQEPHCDGSVGLLQPQTMHRGSSSLASDQFQQSYKITAPAQLPAMEERFTDEVHPTSSKHIGKRRKKGKTNPSTSTPLEAPDHQEPHPPYHNHMNASDSTAAMFQNAQGFNISGDPHFVNSVTVNQHSNPGGSQSSSFHCISLTG
ncbi:hypothetical protein JOM56_011931 [Amanita muscaria]